jgi:hypothetical protein
MRLPVVIAIACLWYGHALAQQVAPDETQEKPPEYNTIVLQGLNKVTGRISKIEGPLGTALRFGNIEIIARRCWSAPPEERPENAALLEISELKAGEGSQRIFLGWMFSSSPGLSGLEHPVYDVSVLACELRSDPEAANAADAPKEEKPKEETPKPTKPKKRALKRP